MHAARRAAHARDASASPDAGRAQARSSRRWPTPTCSSASRAGKAPDAEDARTPRRMVLAAAEGGERGVSVASPARRVVVTGGSSGIGLATAKAFAARGATSRSSRATRASSRPRAARSRLRARRPSAARRDASRPTCRDLDEATRGDRRARRGGLGARRARQLAPASSSPASSRRMPLEDFETQHAQRLLERASTRAAPSCRT